MNYPELFAKCPKCGKLRLFDVTSVDIDFCLFDLKWEEREDDWVCPSCSSYTMNFMEAYQAMQDGKIVCARDSRKRYRINDGKVQAKDPLHTFWVDCNVDPNELWKVVD